jgi:hypothetical protein
LAGRKKSCKKGANGLIRAAWLGINLALPECGSIGWILQKSLRA